MSLFDSIGFPLRCRAVIDTFYVVQLVFPYENVSIKSYSKLKKKKITHFPKFTYFQRLAN